MSSSVQTTGQPELRLVRGVAWAGAAVLALAIVVGLVTAPEGAAAAFLDNVWGRVTVLDLYLALGVVWAWIAWRERSAPRSLAWGVGLVLGGSVVALAYLALAAGRARTVPELLTGPNDIRG